MHNPELLLQSSNCDHKMSRRSFLRLAGVAGTGLVVAAKIPSFLFPPQAQAAGFKEMWDKEINSYYPGDPGIAASRGMRMITAYDSGLAALDVLSIAIAREIYGVEAVFDNLGWYRDFQDQELSKEWARLNAQGLSAAEIEASFNGFRNAFGLCHARTAWAVRDTWPVREQGEVMFDVPDLVAPSFRQMVEGKLFGFAPLAFYIHSDNEAENLAFFRDRALNNPDDVSAAFMVDIPQRRDDGTPTVGEWWGHVAKIEQRRDGYRYYVSRAGEYYQWYPESAIRFAIEPVDYSDLDNPPLDDRKQEGLSLMIFNEKYRSPYYFASFVRAIYYREPLPSRDKLLNFFNRNNIPYQEAA